MSKDITDSSDFKDTEIPKLSQLDSLLRCHVCKDFLKVPVLTPCGHTFCSLCIRGYLNNEPKCPLCLTELRESMLKSEFLVNEIVACFTSLRSDLLLNLKKNRTDEIGDESLIEVTENDEVIVDLDNDDSNNSDSDGKDLKIISMNNNTNTRKRRISDFMMDETPIPLPKGKSKQIKNTKLAPCPICQHEFPITVLERTHLDECLTKETLQPKRNKTLPTSVLHTQDRVINSSKSRPFTLPVSSKNTKAAKKNITSIPLKDDQTDYVENYLKSNRTEENSRQHLPKINFTSMSSLQIKQKLTSLGLSTSGTRTMLINRYNHYEMLWNSNFWDSLSPVSEDTLKRQLITWDAQHNVDTTNKNNQSSSISFLLKTGNTRQSEKSYLNILKDFHKDSFRRKEWSKLFNREFKRLAKDARVHMPKPDIVSESKQIESLAASQPCEISDTTSHYFMEEFRDSPNSLSQQSNTS